MRLSETATNTAPQDMVKMTAPEAHITVQNLTMAYGGFVLMRDLTFTINRGDIFIVMGGQRLRQEHPDDHFDRLEGPGQR